jgi:hypothetical protein
MMYMPWEGEKLVSQCGLTMMCGGTEEVWQGMMGDVMPAVDLSANLTWRTD